MTEDLPATEVKEKLIERELAKIDDPEHREAALEVSKMYKTFGEILPVHARENIKPFILSAVRYIRRNLKGDKFTKESFADAVFDAAQFGLPIDGRLAYALPFAEKDNQEGIKTLVFVPDYKGIVAVAKQKGIVRDVRAYVVHQNDDFKLPGEDSESDGVKWKFHPAIASRGNVIGALCVLEFPDGRRHPEFMKEEDIKIVRATAKTQKVWNAFPDEMRKKTAIRRAFKLHQDDPQFSALLAADDQQYDPNLIDVPKTRVRTMKLPKPKPAAKFFHAQEEPGPEHPETTEEVIEDPERAGLKKAFVELWGQFEAAGLDTNDLGVTDEAGDTFSIEDLRDLVELMSANVAEAVA